MSEILGSFTFLLILGAVVHVMLLISVFDIYFQSSVIHGIEEQHLSIDSIPATRLVLIVADGLRIDKCFGSKLDNGEWAAPYLRYLAENEGVWGRSQTRVPTESRPGHVALIAGFYEDVSAVTTGWKENPVEFDSVFNRSRMTFSWGSPDILLMFSKGTARSKLMTFTYDEREEDFADSNPSKLDTWVFERFEAFLQNAAANTTAKSILAQDKIIFFTHLLGMDTMGHSRKPGSNDYIDGIRVVDEGVERMVKLIEDFYDNDGRTVYIFTADHGMTDWGSHGSSNLEETSTPLVVWGAGIRKPVKMANLKYTEAASWNLSNILAEDVSQADIAPLMSSLIGIRIPLNSVGVVPAQFFSGDDKFKATILYQNARQLGAQFLRHWELKESNSFALFFTSYLGLKKNDIFGTYELISRSLKEGNTENAIRITKDFIVVLLNGIRYFQTYHRMSLCATVLFGFLGWMIYLGCCLHRVYFFSNEQKNVQKHSSSLTVIFILIVTVMLILCYAQRYPPTYYFYNLTSVGIWFLICNRILSPFSTIRNIWFSSTLSNSVKVLFLLSSVEFLVVVFFQRWFLTPPIFLLSIWPMSTNLYLKNKNVCCIWFVTCCVVATFPLFPPIGIDTNYSFVLFSGILALFIASVFVSKYVITLEDKSLLNSILYIVFIQIGLLFVSMVNVWIVSSYIGWKQRVPFICQFLSWIIFASSLILPSFVTTQLFYRLMSVALSLTTTFILFSFTYEALFFVIFLLLLAQWLYIEYKLENLRMQEVRRYSMITAGSSFAQNDLRRAYFSLLMLMAGYFGLGNVANVNSFTVTSVYCFVTVFSPFLMGFLLIWKIIIPLIAVTIIIRAIQKVLNRPPTLLFWSILLLSDVLVVNFFFLIQDEGSWLEIGSSIGRFVVATVTSIAFILFYSISAIFTDYHWSFLMTKRNIS